MRSIRPLFVAVALYLLGVAPAIVLSQPPLPSSLSAEEAVRVALEKSPAVVAARSRLDAASAAVRGSRAPYNLQAELAPGAGFTNGNSALSQRFDISGRRTAETRAAAGEQAAVAASLERVRLQVAAETRVAYFDLVRAQAAEASALETARGAREIQAAVRRRVELGEAPAVQGTRADIEVARVEQEVVRARRDVQSRLIVLNLLLGRAPQTSVSLSDSLNAPAPSDPTVELVRRAMRTRPDLAAVNALIESRRGSVDVARAAGRPDLYADLAADVWSLDRSAQSRPLTSGGIGFQLRLVFPLFDQGGLRAEIDKARALVREQEAERDAITRQVTLEVERGAAELSAAREIVLNYQQAILPQTEALLRVTRSGFDTGLSSFIEVLEAQRVLRQTQAEYQNALFDAARARISLDRAVGLVPGMPPPNFAPPSPRRR
jgi:outer membrane protein, heavy metal efflux system